MSLPKHLIPILTLLRFALAASLILLGAFYVRAGVVMLAEPPRSFAFRCPAPAANSVVLQADWTTDTVPLVRGPDGVWTTQTASLAPGTYAYRVLVDGTPDPTEPGDACVLHVPPDVHPDYPADVAHGDVHILRYQSRALGMSREGWLYTPPGSTDATPALPLLVLQHAGADTQKTWVSKGTVDWLLDQLIAAGRARPMLVLMLDGHPGGESVYTHPATRNAAMEDLRRELLEDAIPQVTARFRVDAAREQTAIAGPSVGGGQALSVGLGTLDRFAWIGAFSAGHPAPGFLAAALADPAGTNARLRLLWLTCATGDDHYQENETFAAALDSAGIRHEWKGTPGAHQWPVWRRDLAEFLVRVFQPITAP